MDCRGSLSRPALTLLRMRLPLRIILQLLFFEQLQLPTSTAGCFLMSENLEGSRPLRSGVLNPNPSNGGGEWATTVKVNQVLKVGMDNMKIRVSELEEECSTTRQEIEKLYKGKNGGGWSNILKKFGFKIKSQICSVQEGEVSDHQRNDWEGREDFAIKAHET